MLGPETGEILGSSEFRRRRATGLPGPLSNISIDEGKASRAPRCHVRRWPDPLSCPSARDSNSEATVGLGKVAWLRNRGLGHWWECAQSPASRIYSPCPLSYSAWAIAAQSRRAAASLPVICSEYRCPSRLDHSRVVRLKRPARLSSSPHLALSIQDQEVGGVTQDRGVLGMGLDMCHPKLLLPVS